MNNISSLKKLFQISVCFIIVFAACRPAKKVQRIGEVITSKDTTSAVVIQPSATDSATVIRNIVDSLDRQRIDFQTFSAKIKMDYDAPGDNGQATAYVRIQKDSVIWLSLTGLLGVEGFRVFITKDSVKVMNKLAKVIQYRPISYLRELTQVPVDFYGLQDIIIGNPVYIDTNIVSYKYNENNLLVSMTGNLFKNLLTLDKSNLRVLHSKLDDVNPARNRTADITYDGYDKVNNFYFSTSRRISVAEKSKLDVALDFKQYNFNQPQSFPFNIPKNYKVK